MDAFWELFSASGRANRAWYFWHVVLDDFAILTAVILMAVLGVVVGPLAAIPMLGVVAAGGWAGVAITMKRLHDIERPSWHFLLMMVPIYNVYLGLLLLFKQGTIGPNQYGPDPLGAPAASRSLNP